MEQESKFVVCIDNKQYSASLEFGKIYRVVEDEKAAEHKMLRVVDESGEDYLYPERHLLRSSFPSIKGRAVGIQFQEISILLGVLTAKHCNRLTFTLG